VAISGLTICNGRAQGTNSSTANGGSTSGGGILNDGAGTLTLTGCVISNNTAIGGDSTLSFGDGGNAFGGGVAGGRIFNDCIITDNSAIGGTGPRTRGNASGGGIYAAVALTNCTVKNNTARGGSLAGENGGDAFGGGIYGVITLMTCTVSNNTARSGDGENFFGAEADGGGIYLSGDNVNLQDSTIVRNSAIGGNGVGPGNSNDGGEAHGGGIYLAFLSGPTMINNCTLSSNTASGGVGGGTSGFGGAAFGGGIDFDSDDGDLRLINCTVTGNSVIGALGGNSGSTSDDAAGRGGGVYTSVFFSNSLSAVSCTVSHNSASGSGSGTGTQGGGIYNASGAVLLTSTIVAQNSATTTNADIRGNFATASSYNLIGHKGNTVGLTNGVNNNQVGGGATSLDPKLGPLQANGGPTRTRALLAGSPAIDKGIAGGLTKDQRGFLRPYDTPAVVNASGGDGSDIGAFEAGLPMLTIVRGAPGQATISWAPNTVGFVLQERTNLNAGNWNNSPSGATNPVTVPATLPRKFYRLRQP